MRSSVVLVNPQRDCKNRPRLLSRTRDGVVAEGGPDGGRTSPCGGQRTGTAGGGQGADPSGGGEVRGSNRRAARGARVVGPQADADRAAPRAELPQVQPLHAA